MKCKDCYYCAGDKWCYVLNYLVHEVLKKPITDDDIAFRKGDLECEFLPILIDDLRS